MAGATAATAAGVTASQVSAVTINLTGNYISAGGGNHLNADLTGDRHPDLTTADAFGFTTNPNHYYTSSRRSFAGVNLNGIKASAFREPDDVYGYVVLGSKFDGGYGFFSLTGSIPIFFKDLHINGGAPTTGSLQVTVSTGTGTGRRFSWIV